LFFEQINELIAKPFDCPGLKDKTRRPFEKGRRAIDHRAVVSVSDYPQTPHPKEAVKRMEKMTKAIIQISSFFIKAPPLQA
jgi:hypothetical protein